MWAQMLHLALFKQARASVLIPALFILQLTPSSARAHEQQSSLAHPPPKAPLNASLDATSNSSSVVETDSKQQLDSTQLADSISRSSASSLEPIYFGRYASASEELAPDKFAPDSQHEARNGAGFYGTHATGAYQPALASLFYPMGKDSPEASVNHDPIARPEFESEAPHSDQIVTLQAFDGAADKSSVAAPSHGSLLNYEALLQALRKLPASKQVQLVNRVVAEREKPSLNLVSGSIRVAGGGGELDEGRPRAARQSELKSLLAAADLLAQSRGKQALSEGPNPEADEEAQLDEGGSASGSLLPALESLAGLKQQRHPTPDAGDVRQEDREFLNSLVSNMRQKQRAPVLASSYPSRVATRQESLGDTQAGSSSAPAPTALEDLVDQLMANSRLSSFGVQQDSLGLPEEEEIIGDDEEEEEEEEEEPDREENLSDEAQESAIILQRRLAPPKSAFSPALNQSTSWVPLDSLDSLSKDNSGKRGEKRRKNGERRIKRKRKKKKKQEAREIGLVVGDKLLSKNDLIRLVGILNKLSSKGKTKSEREASKKLLRHLVKLMLEEYKKNKIKDNDANSVNAKSRDNNEEKAEQPKSPEDLGKSYKTAMREILRPLIEGPTSTGGEKEPSPNHKPEEREPGKSKIEPSLESKAPKTEYLEAAKAASSSDNRNNNNSTVLQLAQDQARDKGSGNPTGSMPDMSQLSEDLEHYFDADFFEDMADGLSADNRSHVGSASGTRLYRVASRRGRRRRPKVIYTLPLYDRPSYDAADEDDTDLDAIPIPLTLRRRRARMSMAVRPIYRSQPIRRARYQELEPARRRRPTVRRRRARKKARESEEEKEEPEDEDEEAAGRAGVQPEDGAVGGQRQETERDTDALDNDYSGQQTGAEGELEPEVESDQEEAPEHSPEQSVALAEREPAKSEVTSTTTELGGRYDDRYPVAKSPVKRRRRFKTRRKSDGRKQNEIDFNSRYEIPAPIAAEKPVLAANKSNRTSSKVDSSVKGKKWNAQNWRYSSSKGQPEGEPKTKRADSLRKAAVSPGSNSTSGVARLAGSRRPAPKQRARRAGNASKPAKARPQERPSITRMAVDADEPITADPVPAEVDKDYYNEGSSYSKVCNVDDKCTVEVRSTNPKLGKAIRQKDQHLVGKQLSSWIATKPD